jgi:Xaa-Pro aminopeptidase
MSAATMHPAVLLGAFAWDPDRLPADEFKLRLEAAHRIMDERGWKALFIYGDAEEHRAIGWFTHFIPRLRWGFAMVPRQGEPRVLVSMSPRDLPAMRLMTWVADVQSGWNWREAFETWLADFCSRQPAQPVSVGILGQHLMARPFLETLRASLGGRVALSPADGGFEALLDLKRPREVALIREACKLVGVATDAMAAAWRGGASGMAAAIAAERAARSKAAHDVRVLFSVDGGKTLLPFYGAVEGRSDPMVAYVAVKYLGYWAEGFVTLATQPSAARRRAEAALAGMLAAARPGVAGRRLAAIARERLGGVLPHPVVGSSAGHAIGLSLDEGSTLAPESSAVLEPGRVYALRAGVADPIEGYAVVSAMVRVTESGVDVLSRSP